MEANTDLAEVRKVFWLPPDNKARKEELWPPDLAIYPPVDIPAPVVKRADCIASRAISRSSPMRPRRPNAPHDDGRG